MKPLVIIPIVLAFVLLGLASLTGATVPAPAPDPKPEVITNSIGMKLVVVPAGMFLMGAADDDKDAVADEKPQHKVRITKAFALGQHTVTVGDYRAFVKDTGFKTSAEKQNSTYRTIRPDGKIEPGKEGSSWEKPGFEITDQHPVFNVDFPDCIAFCDWLSKKESKTYRLPREAEWEYACRAGTTTRWSCGDDKDQLIEVANIVYDSFPTHARSNGPKTHGLGWLFMAPVGQFKPNPWGLHDMHGNMWQWCSDWYDAKYYTDSPTDDPKGPEMETGVRVIRGGTWSRGPLDCRSSNRFGMSSATSLFVGFRVVCEETEKK